MIRLLVVDDSALLRRLLGEVFRAAGGFEIAFARDGEEALAALPGFRPDVVTLDIQMPRMGGLACLDRIMLEHPVPVVVLSAVTEAGAQETLEALALGAVEVLAKPSRALSLTIGELAPRLVETVRAAAGARLRRSHRLAERVRLRTGLPPSPRPAAPGPGPAAKPDATGEVADRLVLIGCSTGGPAALDVVLGGLPAGFSWPVLVAQHMPAAFTGPLARRLDRLCALPVQEVTRPVPLRPGQVYVGHGDSDLMLGRRPDGLVAMSAPMLPEHRWHPSVDRMVVSAMQHLPPHHLIGVLMTGMGNDGAAAMARLRAAGGRTIAEAEATAVVWGMPAELVRAGGAGAVLPLEAIAATLADWTA